MAKKDDTNDNLFCSFCGKNQKEVKKLIAGPAVYICDECIQLCSEIIEEEAEKDESELSHLLIPKEIKGKLDEYVIEQETAKRILSVAVYNHYKRLDSAISTSDVEIEKSNILLIGPTGSGKTLLAQTLARFLNVPFTIADATSLTEAGYVGEDVENIVVQLLQAADYNVARAQVGIVYIDEIDKIGRKEGGNPSITRDVSGEGVQQALLKILEGTIASVPPQGGRKHPEQRLVKVDTSDILFICGGAFNNLDKMIARRIDEKIIGFDAEITDASKIPIGELLSRVTPGDLVQYGLIPELVGRLPITVSLDELSEVEMHHIITEPKNALVKQYKKLFQLDGVELEFTDDALSAIVREALSRKTGARALRNIFESAMTGIMFDMPSHENLVRCEIDADVIYKKGEPKLTFAEDTRQAS